MVDIQLSDAEKTFIIHGVQVKACYIKKTCWDVTSFRGKYIIGNDVKWMISKM